MKRNIFALFGVVAVLLTATAALTFSRATLSEGGGKCAAQFISDCAPYVNAKTSGAAQQKVSITSAVMRSIGRWLAACIK
jgi:hypothetical protein